MRHSDILLALLTAVSAPAAELLVEAEGFANHGGWVLDPQFLDTMGSPYLLAHGLGRPVANAVTEVEFAETGKQPNNQTEQPDTLNLTPVRPDMW